MDVWASETGGKSTTVQEVEHVNNLDYSRKYAFYVNNCYVKVCAVFCQHTLGYKFDTIVTDISNSMSHHKIKPPNDRRGKHTPKHAKMQEYLNIIDKHIESFHPSISH